MIRFLFDYVSPYAYLASRRVRTLGDVEPVPVLFAGLLAHTGLRGPAEVPSKRAYLWHDVLRLARALDVPIAPPATHPFNPLAALRLTHAVEAGARWPLVEALFRAGWQDGERLDDPAVVERIANDVGLDGAALTVAATTEAGKAKLRIATDDAIAAGVFGVPTMLFAGEIFWGVDSLHLLERRLGGDVIAPEELARFHALAPSTTRRHG